MKIRRRTETVVETHEVWVVRRSGEGPSAFCTACAPGAGMLRADEAARLKGVSTRTVFRWVEAGRVHFEETSEGDLFVCLASLPALVG